MPQRTVEDMPIEELRARVEEAEKLLRVARQLAQDELRDPESSGRAKDRIASLCREVNELFPGLGTQEAQPPAAADAAASEGGAAGDAGGAAGARKEEEGAGAESEGDEMPGEGDEVPGEGDEVSGEGDEVPGEGDEEGLEWGIDYDKLRAAVGDPQLMARLPAEHREQFRVLAQQLLDAHDRHELYARITAGFAQLEQTTRAGAEQVRKQLAMMLTLEELKARKRQ